MINVSEHETANQTIQDPLLPDGTTHGFVRRPSHLGFVRFTQWMLRNKPQRPQTYILNVKQNTSDWTSHAGFVIDFLLHARPGCSIVNIHADSDDDIKYGALNTYTKWPTYFIATKVYTDYKFNMVGANQDSTLFDRNEFYKHWREQFPINPKNIWEELDCNLKFYNHWFTERNKLHDWEINETEYTYYTEVPKEKILNISLKEIVQPNFVSEIYAPWVEKQNIGNFDWEHSKKYHSIYVSAQDNLQWYDAIQHFRNTRQVTSFLLKTSLSQAFVLEELETLPNDWEQLSTVDILKKLDYQIINNI
jgi:hypothetical protein